LCRLQRRVASAADLAADRPRVFLSHDVSAKALPAIVTRAPANTTVASLTDFIAIMSCS
jgi:hypothetical protein